MRGWIAASVVLAGCFDPVFTPGQPCAPAPDRCPGELVCVGEVCVPGPGGTPDAPAGGGDAAFDADPDNDVDLDGIKDPNDNCPEVPNSAQYDEEGDGVGDACDVCPHVVDVAQLDGDGDNVGDRCDPNPTTGLDSWVTFEGFNDPAAVAGWSLDQGWTVANGKLVSPQDVTHLGRTLHPMVLARAVVVTRARIIAVDASAGPAYRSAAVLTASDGNKEYRCILRDTSTPGNTSAAVLRDNMTVTQVTIPGVVLGSDSLLELSDRGDALACHGETLDGRTWDVTAADAMYSTGRAGVRVQYSITEFDYLAVILPGP